METDGDNQTVWKAPAHRTHEWAVDLLWGKMCLCFGESPVVHRELLLSSPDTLRDFAAAFAPTSSHDLVLRP